MLRNVHETQREPINKSIPSSSIVFAGPDDSNLGGCFSAANLPWSLSARCPLPWFISIKVQRQESEWRKVVQHGYSPTAGWLERTRIAPRNGGIRPSELVLGTRNAPPKRAGIYHSDVKFSMRSHFFGDAKYFLRFDL